MRAVHPGRILKAELEARSLSANALALALRTPSGRITDIVNGKRAVSTETAMRLGRYFGQSPRFWLDLQTNYELMSCKETFSPNRRAPSLELGERLPKRAYSHSSVETGLVCTKQMCISRGKPSAYAHLLAAQAAQRGCTASSPPWRLASRCASSRSCPIYVLRPLIH